MLQFYYPPLSVTLRQARATLLVMAMPFKPVLINADIATALTKGQAIVRWFSAIALKRLNE